MIIKVINDDLLDQDVDGIVNAWNRNVIPWWLLVPQGVSGAIKKRAGYKPFRELARMGSIPLGGAVLTGPGKLPHKAIIHVAIGAGTGGGKSEEVLKMMEDELQKHSFDGEVRIVVYKKN
jgi:O-acetyl-ADP-ribose deacetylase (regulator of RNase III)